MTIAVILDQRGSKTSPDLVESWEVQLNQSLGSKLSLPFTRTAGDEMQAVIGSPEALGEIARLALVSGTWWMGIGIGEIETPLPADTREGRGSAFWSARDAVAKAKGQRKARPIAVDGPIEHDGIFLWLDECLGALAYIISRRTSKQKRVAEAYEETDGTAQAVARKLGISVQGARQRIRAAGCEEEQDLIQLSARIAERVI